MSRFLKWKKIGGGKNLSIYMYTFSDTSKHYQVKKTSKTLGCT